MASPIVIRVKDNINGTRRYVVECEQHDYRSPSLRIFDNAEDLVRAHSVIAHNKRCKPTYVQGYGQTA